MCENEDACGLCGEAGADKMAKWTGGGVYWPDEEQPRWSIRNANRRSAGERIHCYHNLSAMPCCVVFPVGPGRMIDD